MQKKTVSGLLILIGVAIVLLIFLLLTSGLIQQWLWMRQVGYLDIFWRLLSIKWSLWSLAFLAVFLYTWINFRFAATTTTAFYRAIDGDNSRIYNREGKRISLGFLKPGGIVISAVIALIFAFSFHPEWDTYLRYHWGGAVGQLDPIFGKDIGFYLFRLPFYELIQNSLMSLTFITLLIVIILYTYFGAFYLNRDEVMPSSWKVIGHLSLLFIFLIGVWGWGYYLDR
ncbi:MAG: UPF0182 family protein, partial [Desulfobacterales bacterium]